ncbi:MAG: cytochrome c3 family protein [Pyrinomonadaceae bacterium]
MAISITKRLQIVVLLLACAAFGYAFTMLPDPSVDAEPAVDSDFAEIVPAEPQGDYSRFGHSNSAHSQLPCLLCHRRDDNSPRLKLPGKADHLPCAGCHAAQFADQASPMCTICHTNPQTGAMKGFPSIRNFNIKFTHSRHTRQTNCATCHKATGRGAALSVPKGSAAHTTCFQCHTANKPIGSCDTCHSPGRPVRGSESAKAFSLNFSHQEHIRKGNMNCATCHSVLAGGARGRQVTSPAASMHFPPRGQSCGSCHNNKRAFGPPDFADCKRCHEGKNFRF